MKANALLLALLLSLAAAPGFCGGLRLEMISRLEPGDTPQKIEKKTGVQVALQSKQGRSFLLFQGRDSVNLLLDPKFEADVLRLEFCGPESKLCWVYFNGLSFFEAIDKNDLWADRMMASNLDENMHGLQTCFGVMFYDKKQEETQFFLVGHPIYQTVLKSYLKARDQDLKEFSGKVQKARQEGEDHIANAWGVILDGFKKDPLAGCN